MHRTGLGILICLCSFSCSDSSDTPQLANRWYNGVDLSFQPQIDAEGFDYKDEMGTPLELLGFLGTKNINLVRLRLWVNPVHSFSSLDEVTAYAQQLKEHNLKLLLSIHYSDTWADPGNQTIPAAWQNLGLEGLKNEIYNYTKEVLLKLKEVGAELEIVQIGNETNQGFLWDLGKIEDQEGWNQYRELTGEAIKAVREVSKESMVMLHYAGVVGADEYFNGVGSLDFDVIGLSFYSRWHSGWEDLQSQMNELVTTYNKDLMIVETAYPWTLEWNDFTNNIWGLEEHLLDDYTASPEGQRDFMLDLISKIENIPNNRGIGFCYWAPDWVAYRGTEARDGSSWENAAMFDFEGKALPVTDVFASQ